MLQNAVLFRKSAAWPPNISHKYAFCTAPATENVSLQILFKCSISAIVFGNATKPLHFAYFWQGAQPLVRATRNELWMSKSGFRIFWFRNMLRATTVCTFSTSQVPKMIRTWYILKILIWKCFAPQRCVLYFQKRSDHGIFYTFWFGNLLRVITTCNFSSFLWPNGSASAALVSLLFDPSGNKNY